MHPRTRSRAPTRVPTCSRLRNRCRAAQRPVVDGGESPPATAEAADVAAADLLDVGAAGAARDAGLKEGLSVVPVGPRGELRGLIPRGLEDLDVLDVEVGPGPDAVLRGGVRHVDGAAVGGGLADVVWDTIGRDKARLLGLLWPEGASAPVAAERNVQDNLLWLGHVKAGVGIEGQIGNHPAIPAGRVGSVAAEVQRYLVLRDVEDIDAAGVPRGGDDPRVLREPPPGAPDLRRLAAQAVGGVVCVAVVDDVGVDVGPRHAPPGRAPVEGAVLVGVEGHLARVVVGVLQDVELAAPGPEVVAVHEPEGRPDARPPGHVPVLHDDHEASVRPPRLGRVDHHRLALEDLDLVAHSDDGAVAVGQDDRGAEGLRPVEVPLRAVRLAPRQELPVVEEGPALGFPHEAVGVVQAAAVLGQPRHEGRHAQRGLEVERGPLLLEEHAAAGAGAGDDAAVGLLAQVVQVELRVGGVAREVAAAVVPEGEVRAAGRDRAAELAGVGAHLLGPLAEEHVLLPVELHVVGVVLEAVEVAGRNVAEVEELQRRAPRGARGRGGGAAHGGGCAAGPEEAKAGADKADGCARAKHPPPSRGCEGAEATLQSSPYATPLQELPCSLLVKVVLDEAPPILAGILHPWSCNEPGQT
mmetsp:Transcript_1575/g.5149  ORF Transcript_1575/g.5149 Transcript_1575/m.5149 type:complete len:639 (+) Transcript_1575:2-1918(+)